MDSNITLNTIAEKRDYLRKLSNPVAVFVKNGHYPTINEAVIDVYYKSNEHTTFKSFPQWLKEGYSVKKGSKAFLIWGKPVKQQEAGRQQEQGKPEQEADDMERDFFPLAFVFSNAQVERRAQK